MAGQWLGVPPGWWVSPANGNTGGSRFVVRGPNGRRWECRSRPRHELIDWALALHKEGACASVADFHAKIPPRLMLDGVVEISQRKCRSCTEVLELHRFRGASRCCTGCTRRLCGGPRSQLGDCPACGELCRVPSLTWVATLGLACPLCVAEVKAETAPPAALPVVRHELDRPCAPRPSVDMDGVLSMRDLADIFGPGPATPLRPAPLLAVATAPAPTLVRPAESPTRRRASKGTPASVRLPQVRDFGRLRLLLQLVASGMTGTKALGEAMGSKPSAAARHACFYREAAEILGLLEARCWTVTALGERFLAAPAGSHDEREALREAVAGSACLGPLAAVVLAVDVPELQAVIEEMAALLPKLSRATVERRVKDTLSWRSALGLAPLGRVRARRVPAPVVSAPLLQLELWRPSANDQPSKRRPCVRNVHGSAGELHAALG
jgi:hypothetical protein